MPNNVSIVVNCLGTMKIFFSFKQKHLHFMYVHLTVSFLLLKMLNRINIIGSKMHSKIY